MNRRYWASVLALAFLTANAWSATVELVPLFGYQLNGEKNLAGPTYNRIDFKSGTLRGLSAGYLTNEDGQVELAWTHSSTSADIQRAGFLPPDHLDVQMDRFLVNFMYMTDDPPIQPFVLLGLGSTLYTPSGNRSSTALFTFAIGGGFKWLWNDHIGLRFDGRWVPSLAGAGTHFFCDQNNTESCYSTESNSYVSHVLPFLNSFEFTSGLMLRY